VVGEPLASGQAVSCAGGLEELPIGRSGATPSSVRSDQRTKPAKPAWNVSQQAPPLQVSDEETFKLLNLSRRPALKPKEPLQDGRRNRLLLRTACRWFRIGADSGCREAPAQVPFA
jgi:hypothetical protein